MGGGVRGAGARGIRREVEKAHRITMVVKEGGSEAIRRYWRLRAYREINTMRRAQTGRAQSRAHRKTPKSMTPRSRRAPTNAEISHTPFASDDREGVRPLGGLLDLPPKRLCGKPPDRATRGDPPNLLRSTAMRSSSLYYDTAGITHRPARPTNWPFVREVGHWPLSLLWRRSGDMRIFQFVTPIPAK